MLPHPVEGDYNFQAISVGNLSSLKGRDQRAYIRLVN